jgi:hypothetical protein
MDGSITRPQVREAGGPPGRTGFGQRLVTRMLLAGVLVGMSVLAGASDAHAAVGLVAHPAVGLMPHVAVQAVMPRAVNDLPTIVTNLRNWVMGLLAGLATLFLTIGGVRYVMAGGDPSEIEKAKGAFRSAAVGYVMAVIAPVILTVLKSIIGG